MKWITVIFCLLLTSFAESNKPSRRYWDVEHQVPKREPRIEILKDMDMETFFLGIFSQFLQQANFEEVHKLVEDAATFSKKCFADGFAGPGCNDSLFSFFPDQICSAKGLPEKYGYADCCTKAGSERNDCLISHKNVTPGFIPPYQKPNAEEVCTQFQANPKVTVQRFIYELARRDPMKFAESFFVVRDTYKKSLTTCCQAAKKEQCFTEEISPASKRQLEFQVEPLIHCVLLKKFGIRALESVEHILLSQQFPKANVSTVFGLAKHLAEAEKDCCQGDSVKCFSMERDAQDYLCNNHDTISTKIKEVCEREGLERNTVLSLAENDDKPSDLPPIAQEFIEDKDVCRYYTENQAAHLGKFRYEIGRRHPELPQYLLLRHAERYENLLKNCCSVEHPEQCLPQGEGQLEKEIADTMDLVKIGCDIYKLREFGSEILVLVLPMIMPQLSSEEMFQYTKEMKNAARECCHLNDTKKLACLEGKVETILGSLCSRHLQKPINVYVDSCCSAPFPFWIQCFIGFRVNTNYTHVPSALEFNSDLCLPDGVNLERRKQTLSKNLVAGKPDITEKQINTIITGFQEMVVNCCTSGKKEECFKEEGPKLIEWIRAVSGRN